MNTPPDRTGSGTSNTGDSAHAEILGRKLTAGLDRVLMKLESKRKRSQ